MRSPTHGLKSGITIARLFNRKALRLKCDIFQVTDDGKRLNPEK